MTVYNVGEIYLEDLSGGTSDQLHILAQTGNIADGAVTDAKLAPGGVLLDLAAASRRQYAIARGYHDITCYSCKRDTYISAGAETALANYDTYTVPVSAGDLVYVTWTGNFWYNLNPNYAIKGVLASGGYKDIINGALKMDPESAVEFGYLNMSTYKTLYLIVPDGIDALTFTTYKDNADMIDVVINAPYLTVGDMGVYTPANYVLEVTDDIAIRSIYYPTEEGRVASPGYGYHMQAMRVHAGDRLVFSTLVLSWYARLAYTDGTFATASTKEFTALSDGIVFIPQIDSDTARVMYYPADSAKINIANIVGNLENIKWVSFGDSITAREAWQPYVVQALGMTHYNCGIGSTALSGSSSTAFWQAARLDAVKAQNPDIVTILGGANDLVLNPVIGTSANIANKDTSTFIGAYSYIINDLLTWKPSLKIFILSTTFAHNDGADLGSTVTYGQFAEACKLVAESYHLPYVNLYDESGFNSYTMGNSPNNVYSDDHIHPNDAGGRVIAAFVTAKMLEVLRFA